MARFHYGLDDLDGPLEFNLRPANKPDLHEVGLARELTVDQCNGLLGIVDFDDGWISGLQIVRSDGRYERAGYCDSRCRSRAARHRAHIEIRKRAASVYNGRNTTAKITRERIR